MRKLDHLAKATYFEGRAKRAKYGQERKRFRLIAEKYRALAKADSPAEKLESQKR
jgi:hypothetical protein